MAVPRVIIIAGPYGAGKTTFARQYLPNEGKCKTFLNADLIAEGISPFDPAAKMSKAVKILLNEIELNLERRDSFALESTLSSKTYINLIPQWRGRGFEVEIIFLHLPSVALSIARTQNREALGGGPPVLQPLVERRFERGWHKFNTYYKSLVDRWQLFDTGSEVPRVVDDHEVNYADSQYTQNALRRAANDARSHARQHQGKLYYFIDNQVQVVDGSQTLNLKEDTVKLDG